MTRNDKEDKASEKPSGSTAKRASTKKGLSADTTSSSSLADSPAEYDKRTTLFLTEIGTLSQADWQVVAQRFSEEKRTLAKTLHRANDILADVCSGKVKPFGRTERKWFVMVDRSNAVMHAVTSGLPDSVVIKGKTVPLQEPAYLAVYHAVSALKVFAELDHAEGGRDVVVRSLSPFAGLTTSIVA